MNDTTPLESTPAPEQSPVRRNRLRPILIGVGSGVAVLALGIGGFAIADEFRGSSDDRLVINSSDVPVTPANPDVTTPAGAATPAATGAGHDDRTYSSDEYAEVSAAAIAAVGGGTVTDVKRDDEHNVAWEVDVAMSNGDEAEVELAADLSVVRIQLDRNDDNGDD